MFMGCVISAAQWFYNKSIFSLASLACRLAIRCSPEREGELLGLLSKSELRRRRYNAAFECFLQNIDLPASQSRAERAPPPAIVAGDNRQGAICVFTSVMPRRIKPQQAAIRSWVAAGLSVVSVNSELEIDQLRNHFPEITFKVADSVANDSRSRPLIPLQSMVRTAKASSADICGIVNSDIEFRGDPIFFDRIREEISGALVFGNRTDYKNKNYQNGESYRNGYDFFFWERLNSSLFEDTPMILGLPWWDFWMPLQASGHGLKTKRFVTSAMAHIVHPVGYDILAYLAFERQMAMTLAGVFGRWGEERVPAQRMFLHRLFATAATIPVDVDNDLARRRVMAVCTLSNCLVDALADTVVLPDAGLAAGSLHLL
jgi:hypothetical protein